MSLGTKNSNSEKGENNVKQLAKIFSLALRDIPNFLKENADLLVKVIENMCTDDPIMIIEWADPFPRNGRNQTKRSLINYITTHGGVNEFNSRIIFSFRSGRQLTDCFNGLPDWCRHDRINLNVLDVGCCYCATKVTERTADLENCRYVFNI
ncbi:uncharacterized protein OCT59_008278 [Rhizophagus irregularis]|uniref:Uncharacterized protein n=2 Tax=Rhizophagus irregularis TaxID=588596 RepID=U9SZR3_RHIID|nr:hypothetical protein GLOIN_2v1670988 [Rhizophagus irregularis DAOM 181602=DAOM 197198]EXX51526.1 hypothetical protein RirG_260900 [Rhizophagus irregularis DAOM 197198w]UZO16912.1 hypothetical protein OCT59_008278 [Rhizophagus irregularis]POG64909.1 hypothetical protein GLOIN_2v1670988 [Rhizophagus irregularis DAOM 181602=DAOM 197198]CAG8462554.1 4504_t:CDS:2 [Rhizophagus irregularis]GBC42584.1 hypothetical protein GLOIN_2v1670988 [Rhizophagus irregularis DAOM 181602=DAOM 197198]|eukprot:XP_025171775.1 hypothetical protein GLOIN_2v1670988 [Rhizophagus irregularis DAOM 181602=DAOM 197198]